MPPESTTTYAITDISNAEELIHYAVASQFGQLAARPGKPITQTEIAKAIDMDRSNFNRALGGKQKFSEDQLKQLDEVYVSLGLDYAGGLSALAVRLRGSGNWASLGAHIPPSWADEVLGAPATNENEVMIQATALVSRLRAAYRAGRPVHYANRELIHRVVNQLILIGAAPPTRRNVEALVLLGNLAGYTFDLMQHELESALNSPLGFRVWRAISKSVILNATPKNKGSAPDSDTHYLQAFVRRLLQEANDMRERSLYPGRSLDLELAIMVPATWSPPEDDWIADVLLTRAKNERATLRERATAAFGLWERAVAGRGRNCEGVRHDLQALIEEFRVAFDRPDIASGMFWTAATLQQVIDDGSKVCNEWPHTDEPWLNVVKRAGERLNVQGVPANVRPATRKLFEHALLQNAGVYRRQAVDTLVAAGWAREIAPSLAEVLRNEQDESWLRIRALFTLGFMQNRSDDVARTLIEACNHVYQRLDKDSPEKNPTALVTELHAALFAIGDCFGPRDAQEQARGVRESIRSILEFLVTKKGAEPQVMWPAARATAYLLAVTAQPRRPDQRLDLAQVLLGELRTHPDSVTRQLSDWALSFRFTKLGEVKPLLSAARGNIGTESDSPDSSE